MRRTFAIFARNQNLQEIDQDDTARCARCRFRGCERAGRLDRWCRSQTFYVATKHGNKTVTEACQECLRLMEQLLAEFSKQR